MTIMEFIRDILDTCAAPDSEIHLSTYDQEFEILSVYYTHDTNRYWIDIQEKSKDEI